MGERVLCGCVRLEGKASTRDEACAEHIRRLESTVPFVYRSVRSKAHYDKVGSRSVIRDQVERRDTRWSGIHSVLKVLRQPVLFLSASAPPPDQALLEKFTDQWNRCPERLSGVFLKTDGSFQRYPGLYAAPMLPLLRATRRTRTITMNQLVKNEPTRRIKLTRSD